MVKRTVLYDVPDDIESFERYYLETHVPLARTLPDLRRLEVSRVVDGERYHMMAELWFDDVPSMTAAFESSVGAAVIADVPSFAPGGSTGLVSEVLDA